MEIKTKKQIESCIKKVTKTYLKLPEYSGFGDPNWKIGNKIVETLKKCIGKDKYQLQENSETLLDVLGEDYMDEPLGKAVIDVYDWILGIVDDLC